MFTRKILVIERGNDIKGKEPFSFYVNNERIELSKDVSIMISKLVHDEYLRQFNKISEKIFDSIMQQYNRHHFGIFQNRCSQV